MSGKLSRRGFLAATAPVAAVTAGLVALPTVAQASPAFAAFALRFDEAEAAYRKAEAEHAQARGRLFAMAPAKAPDDLLVSDDDRRFCGEHELTPDYKTAKPIRHISTVHHLLIEVQDYGPRTKTGREARRRLPIAQAYEDAMDHARETSGYNAAESARFRAALALMSLAIEVFDMPAETMADVGIKARAFLAGGHSDECAPHIISVRHGLALAEDVARLTGGAA
ncbi:hypothetical protein IHQ68_13745 [Chelatococcus sambhunathii]|uniref:Twin-arginine translocation signal domain-containing protein n=1 Tax=Chelatococcus sambhunathii TaxID=363953 RepID=A0ABU1DHU3_9HYPH|nr:hypothetical protein [Chelatococcus sambhunathii]MDR4307681.1 hypothetical protein [Chelatococcus sambhunathii]